MVAFGDSYATLADFKAYMKQETRDANDDTLQDALDTATAEVNRITNRVFWTSDAATPRVYTPESYLRCKVDDFYTTDGLVVECDQSRNGNFTETWASTDYELSPLNGIVDGEPGWPYWKLKAVGNFWFPLCLYPQERTGVVRITAKWGWADVPYPVKRATMIIAAENWKLKDAPLGVAGFNQFGVLRVRQNTAAMSKLNKYIRKPVMLG
jgi:hypothetical protein